MKLIILQKWEPFLIKFMIINFRIHTLLHVWDELFMMLLESFFHSLCRKKNFFLLVRSHSHAFMQNTFFCTPLECCMHNFMWYVINLHLIPPQKWYIIDSDGWWVGLRGRFLLKIAMDIRELYLLDNLQLQYY